MPAEPTKARLKRHSSRKDLEEYRFDGGHARELELKRNRGEVSCAECRRLKIKCDKQIPCQSCQRRGCATLCPNGSLATGQGTRFVLAATEHLHRRIATLSGRIQQLEDALAVLQSEHSKEPHPLLHEDLVYVEDREDSSVGIREESPVVNTPATDVIDAFGTLSISDHGISRFFGPTGGSESLLLANLNLSPASPTDHNAKDPASAGPGDLSLFSQSFPFTPMGPTTDVQQLIETHLPSWDRAVSFCELYLEQVAWSSQGLTRVQLLEDMLPVIYRRQSPLPGEDYSGPHDLALLFVVFAIGALVQSEPSYAQAEHFHQIARAALSLQAVLEKPSVVTIQTLHLMSIYNAMSGSDLQSETSMEMTWSLIKLAAHMSQTIGLHRDSARWGLSTKMIERRRSLFWDLFAADVWQSLNTGRPPSFSLAYVDCNFPQHGSEPDGTFASAFEVWQCRFAAECVADVTARALTAEAPSYATIMELDRKVREFPLPEGMSNLPTDLATSFQRCILDHTRETVLMYVHRSFFAQAIIEHPINPLKSPYAPSFLAAYRASSTILRSVREQFNIWPNSCSRVWTIWTVAFSAAVVFGTVVTRGPRSPLASSAMSELEQACILFSKASVYSIRAAKALPILTKLSEKARYALASAQKDPSSEDTRGLLWNIKVEDTDDELSILAGHTRFVSKQHAPTGSSQPSPTSYHQHVPTTSSQPSPTSYHQQPSESYMQQASHYEHPTGASIQQPQPTPTINMDHWMPHPNQQEYVVPPAVHDEDPPRLHYPYVPSECAPSMHPHPPSAGAAGMGWHNSTREHPRHYIQHLTHGPVPAPIQYTAPIHTHTHMHTHIHYQPPPHPPPHPHPPPPGPPPAYPHHPHHVHHQMYATTPAGPSSQLPNSGLADLGLASRDSRLDERWSSFMEDSGLLEGTDFRTR